MPDTPQKLRPDRDLQCYFLQSPSITGPAAVAALSETSATGFKLTGSWRQQFDWVVVEWNRDNVFEHPAFRCLPDGDLSGIVLSYEETRTNCIPADSDLYPTVDWPYLRIWAETPPSVPGGDPVEKIFFVKLADHRTAVAGAYSAAYAEFTLSGSVTAGDFVGLAHLGTYFTYHVVAGDTLDTAVQAIVDGMNGLTTLSATRTGTTIRASIASSTVGANGNRFYLFSYATGAATWDKPGATFDHGSSPTTWQYTFDFSSLSGNVDTADGAVETIPTNKIRKMRWTYAADLQPGAYVRGDFEVAVSAWSVTGTGLGYSVAGPTSRRVEDNGPAVTYTGTWSEGRGNFSGGSIHFTTTPGDKVSLTYQASATHTIYLGTRYTNSGGRIAVKVDGVSVGSVNLYVPQEDVLIRWRAGDFGAGTHTAEITHAGASGTDVYFDFLELAVPVTDLPTFPSIPNMTLATDWDTDHSLAIAPERTAWFIYSLGFHGRQNHYVGAQKFYELYNPTHVYATATVTFSGTADAGSLVSVTIGPAGGTLTVSHVIQPGESLASVALSFALEFNRGYTGIWASASGGVLTIQSRALGVEGEANTLTVTTTSGVLTVVASSSTLAGAADGAWQTDLGASPRLNRAARDWMRSFFAALHGYGIDAAAAFSTEIKHGDSSVAAGIAQRGPAGDPILLPTPALQTNFSPTSLAFWKQVHADCAQVMVDAGLTPFLQFGEVQWWYFPNDGLGHVFSGMPFYDAWTQSEFTATYGHAMAVFTDNTANPASYPDEVAFLPSVIGGFTAAVMTYVRATFPTARFEVLYPFDVNQTAFNRAINFPATAWTPTALTSLKTEGLSLTFTKKLQQSAVEIDMGVALGFPATQRSHLVGLGDTTAPWLKEARMAVGKGFESVVLFALDQFCLIGYEIPLSPTSRRAIRIRY